MSTVDSSALGPLRPGDRVALLATAGPSPEGQVDRAEQLLASWGLKPVTYPSATSTDSRASYLSGQDSVRGNDFSDAWCDETIRGIFCARGGYGSVRMLDLLDVDRMRTATAKPVYGSSDITALHEWLREQLAVASWFTPMVATDSLLGDEAATEQLRVAVFDDPSGRRWSAETAEVLLPGTASGTLIGGNLSLLAMTLAAKSRPTLDNSGTIALLEDVTEDAYRIDGYLQSLRRAGWFDGVAGIALGSWLDCSSSGEIRALCLETLAPLSIPVIWELGFGHCAAAKSIPLGVKATLVAEPDGTPELILDSGIRDE